MTTVARMRLPDAARVALYHKDFFGVPMGAWTQATMRGPSPWSVGERELMAAMVAKWNSCAFCEGAHGAVAAKEMQRPPTLVFLEIMTLRPTKLTPGHARAVLGAGVSAEALTDAIAVGAIFNIVTRYADALDFTLPTADEFERAASMLLKRGYAS